jgi:hypothetical protein
MYIAMCGSIKSPAESLKFSSAQLTTHNKYCPAVLKIVDNVEQYEV